MAQRSKIIKTTITSHPEDEERERPREVEKDPAEIQYSEFMQKFRGAQGCRVKLYRQTPSGRGYCLTEPPEQIDEEYVRLYHARQPNANEEGVYYLVVSVNGEDHQPFTVRIAPQVGTPGSNLKGGTGGMADLNSMLMTQIERLEARLNAQEKTPMIEMVDALSKLDQLRGGASSGGTGMSMDNMLKAVEIGQKLGAPEQESWQGLLMSVLKENAGGIIALGRAMMSNRPQPPAEVAAPAVSVPVPENPPISTEMPVELQEREILIEAIKALKRKARSGSDPRLYVALIDDNREDPLYARLISLIAENEFSAFIELDPELDKFPFRDWFRSIYDGVRSILAEDNPVATDTGGSGGNKEDTSGNGASRKRSGKRS